MTQVKLWQIVGQTPNTIIFSDADGNLTTLPAGTQDQVLVINAQGIPEWVNNTALSTALEAKTDATNALNTAKAYTEAQIAALVDNAPMALNTLNELAVKLNGEDSAINALLLQVEGKAEKTEVDTLVAQTKQDTLLESKAYTDGAVAGARVQVTGEIATAKGEAIAAASADATQKADTARQAAIQSANTYTDQSVAGAIDAAKTDATAKADAAKTGAVAEAGAYTDGAVTAAVATAEQTAQTKATIAKTEAIGDAHTYTDNKIEELPGRLFARTVATACFVASSNGLNPENLMLSAFAEVTGAVLPPGSVMTPKLLFVNGLAMSSDWSSLNSTVANTKITFGQPLLSHAFDGTNNAIMILCEYTTRSEIYAMPAPVYNPPQFQEPAPAFPNP